MTVQILEVAQRGVTWELDDITFPGGCMALAWCGGWCEAPTPDDHSVTHGREVAVATVNDEIVLTIHAAQRKAVKPWRLTANAACPNFDGPPEVVVFRWEDGEPRWHALSLPAAEAAGLVSALRVVGGGELAAALQNAVDLATAITKDARS